MSWLQKFMSMLADAFGSRDASDKPLPVVWSGNPNNPPPRPAPPSIDTTLEPFIPPIWTGDPNAPPQPPAQAIDTSQPTASQPIQPGWQEQPHKRVCPTCNGARTEECKMCHGRGTWQEQPQTEFGQGEIKRCGYCFGSGRMRCETCNGEGEIW